MKPNRIRQVAAEGRVPVGHMLMEFNTRGIAKLCESADLDFVLIDMEHSGFGVPEVANLIAWFKATSIAPIVRTPATDEYDFIARIMDAGAKGIMAPNVRTPEQARNVNNAMRFAPAGGRGLGLGTAHNDYIPPDPVGYMTEANQENFLIAQIESRTALENLEELGKTPGVDCLWVGHFDLTQSMGIVAQFQHPDFLAAMERVVDVAKRNGILAGIQPGNPEQAKQWMGMGFNLISYSADFGVYRTALKSAVEMVRGIG